MCIYSQWSLSEVTLRIKLTRQTTRTASLANNKRVPGGTLDGIGTVKESQNVLTQAPHRRSCKAFVIMLFTRYTSLKVETRSAKRQRQLRIQIHTLGAATSLHLTFTGSIFQASSCKSDARIEFVGGSLPRGRRRMRSAWPCSAARR